MKKLFNKKELMVLGVGFVALAGSALGMFLF